MNQRNYKSDLSIDEKVLMAIVKAAEKFKKDSSAIFTKYDLTFSQYNVLRALDASRNGQNTLANIRGIMLVSGSRITGLTKRLEKNGFIIRKSCTDDERTKTVELTPKGKKTLEQIFPEKERNVKKYLIKHPGKEKLYALSIIRGIFRERENEIAHTLRS